MPGPGHPDFRPGQPDFRPRLSPPEFRCHGSPPSSCPSFRNDQPVDSCNSRLPTYAHKDSCPPSNAYIFHRPDEHVRPAPEFPPAAVPTTGSLYPTIPWESMPPGPGFVHPYAKTLPIWYSAIPNPPRPVTLPTDPRGCLIKPEPMDADDPVEETPPDRRTSLDQTFNHLFSLQTQLNRVLDAFTLTCGKLNPTLERVKDFVLIHQVNFFPKKNKVHKKLAWYHGSIEQNCHRV